MVNDQLDDIPWPPAYKIKKHPKAKRVKLDISKRHGLQITVPPRFKLGDMSSILESHKQWIIEKLKHYQPFQPLSLPATINLAAMQEIWRVEYMACDTRMRIMSRPHREIVVFGPVADHVLCQRVLVVWLKKMAKIHLLAELKHISETLQLPFVSASIRGQQTRWGSCTVDKTISLNYKLLFLPPKLMRHVLIHELCHTKHLNHSAKFWQLVAKHDAEWHAHRRALLQADQYVPAWAV